MKIVAEYIWLDINSNFRSKTKIFSLDEGEWWQLQSYPIWNYDGSSTGDIPENKQHATECLLYPVAIYDDPFNINTDTRIHMLVFCKNSYIINDKETGVHPLMFNKLEEMNTILEKEGYQFGFEQEFFLINPKTGRPFGITEPLAITQGDYYCGVGCFNVENRAFLADCQTKLLDAGIQLTGFNYEVAPSQAEFQVCDYGLEACYQLLILRYILKRNGELHNIHVSYSNIIYRSNNINNSGCHINISNHKMRTGDEEKYGAEYILDKINELGDKTPGSKEEFNNIFGNGNVERLTGELETSKWNHFDWGFGTRNTSIRIPIIVKKNNAGYFEDRRPGANIDPFSYLNYLLF